MTWTFDRSGTGLLRLTGSDTRRFLNSTLTNNIRDLQVGHGNHNAITDSKARLQGLLDAYVLREDQALLVLDDIDAEWAYERLDMYIIMDPIELEALDLGLFSVQGPGAVQALEAAGLPVPEADVASWEEGWVLRSDRVAAQGFDLVAPLERLQGLTLPPRGDEELYEALRIRRGIPRWPKDMGQRAFVHELGIRDRVSNFNKGCYMGQEVINRMDTMGKVNKKLVGVVFEAEIATPQPLTVQGEAAGEVRSAALWEGRSVALAMARKAAWEEGTAVAAGDVPGRVIPLPMPEKIA